MKRMLLAITMFASSALPVLAGEAGSVGAGEAAEELVDLVRPHEQEAQAIQFMLAVAPGDLPVALGDCTVEEAMPAMRSYFASQFAENMSAAELQQAIEFFRSPEGQSIVDLRLEHEQRLFDAARRKERVADERLHYPATVQRALEAFGSTPAGTFFVGDALLAREAVRSRVSELRSEAMARCMAAP